MLRSVIQKLLAIILMSGIACQLAYADEAFVNRSDVQEYIQSIVTKYKFNKQDLVNLFSQVKFVPVIRHINKPLEKEPWRFVSNAIRK